MMRSFQRLTIHPNSKNERLSGSWLCENALAEALTTRDFGEVAVFGAFSVWNAPDADSSRLERLCDRIRAHVCDDYARIAASSGWTPMMFMMRVRL